MRIAYLGCILSLSLLFSGCTQPSEQSSNDGEPKTTFGQAVHRADHLSDSSDERNEEIEAQADGLFEDS